MVRHASLWLSSLQSTYLFYKNNGKFLLLEIKLRTKCIELTFQDYVPFQQALLFRLGPVAFVGYDLICTSKSFAIDL